MNVVIIFVVVIIALIVAVTILDAVATFDKEMRMKLGRGECPHCEQKLPGGHGWIMCYGGVRCPLCNSFTRTC